MAETDDSTNRAQAHAIIQAVVQEGLDTDQPFQTTFRGRPPLPLSDGQELSGIVTPETLQEVFNTVIAQVLTELFVQALDAAPETDALPDDTTLVDADWNAKIDAVLAEWEQHMREQE